MYSSIFSFSLEISIIILFVPQPILAGSLWNDMWSRRWYVSSRHLLYVLRWTALFWKVSCSQMDNCSIHARTERDYWSAYALVSC